MFTCDLCGRLPRNFSFAKAPIPFLYVTIGRSDFYPINDQRPTQAAWVFGMFADQVLMQLLHEAVATPMCNFYLQVVDEFPPVPGRHAFYFI